VNSWKVIFPTLVIFGAGVVTGALVVNLSTRITQPVVVTSPPAPHVVEAQRQQQQTDLLHRMDKQLLLTGDQHKKLEKVLKDSQKRSKVIRDHVAPQLKEELERVRKEIMAELTPEQQKKFEELPHSGALVPRKPDRMEDERPRKKGGEKKKMTNSLPTSAPKSDGDEP
jgi:Spy/CpxP family protein refolding chaperone